jgi:hypothetical protein
VGGGGWGNTKAIAAADIEAEVTTDERGLELWLAMGVRTGLGLGLGLRLRTLGLLAPSRKAG